jgi:hypothetical protein
MAIILLGGGVAQASGSVGGVTFSRNRGGAYMRTRAIPVDPGTSEQSRVRAATAQCATRWQTQLTTAQREAWDTYALNVPLPNALGQPRNVGGIGMYIRSNVPRILLQVTGIDIVDDAPTEFNLGDYSAPAVVSLTAATDTLSMNFTEADDWVTEDGAAMIVWGSRARPPSINFFKGPYRESGSVVGNSTTPPTTPAAIVNAFGVQAGDRTFFRANVTRADGRLGSSFRFFGTGA